MDCSSKNLTNFIWIAYPKFSFSDEYGLHVQKHNYILHLPLYILHVQKLFALGHESNFALIKSFYFGQSFLYLQLFTDLFFIVIIIYCI